MASALAIRSGAAASTVPAPQEDGRFVSRATMGQWADDEVAIDRAHCPQAVLARRPSLPVPLPRTVGGFRFSLFAGPRLLPPSGAASPRGATRPDSFGDGTSHLRTGHCGLRNVPPAHGRHRGCRDCASVRPSLSPRAVGVLTEGSNYRGRRTPAVGRKPIRDRRLVFGFRHIGRPNSRTGPTNAFTTQPSWDVYLTATPRGPPPASEQADHSVMNFREFSITSSVMNMWPRSV